MAEIKVTVQTEKRLNAINNLSQAIADVAKALSSGTHVTVNDCNFVNTDMGIQIETDEKVTETKIENLDKEVI